MLKLVKEYKILIGIGLLIIFGLINHLNKPEEEAKLYLEAQGIQEVQEVQKEQRNLLESETAINVSTQAPIIEEKENEEESDIADEEHAGSKVVTSEVITPSIVPVYICGAVQNPGVYYLEENAIVDELIKLCGGFTSEADALSINLARPICANEKIIIPKMGEEIDKYLNSYDNREVVCLEDNDIDTQLETENKTKLVDINEASKEMLMTLPGIGEVKAEAIITYRATMGSFTTIEEIMEVSGIGDKTFEKLKTLITIRK